MYTHSIYYKVCYNKDCDYMYTHLYPLVNTIQILILNIICTGFFILLKNHKIYIISNKVIYFIRNEKNKICI